MRLPVRRPFHLEATVRLLQRRPSNLVDIWDGSGYRRVLRADEKYLLCTVRNVGSIEAPSLELSIGPSAISRVGLAGIKRTLGIVLGLEEDPSFAVPGARLPQLRVLERALRGARPPRFPTLFESFCRIIPYQQLSLDAGGVLVGASWSGSGGASTRRPDRPGPSRSPPTWRRRPSGASPESASAERRSSR